MTSSQDFTGASAGQNIVAGDFTQINNYDSRGFFPNVISDLVCKLEKEIADQLTTSAWIEDLVFFEEPLRVDDVDGLEAKLEAAGMADRKLGALRQKELFAKFLEKRALYDAAQQLLALCLHRIWADFDTYIHPACGSESSTDLNQRIHEKVVTKIVADYGCGAFPLNHSLVFGMTYWLADRCYVRWHQAAAA